MSNNDAGAGLATFSAVLGVFSFFCFGLPAIPAVLFGHGALGHIGSLSTSNARGRAWVGLVFGYVNLSIFGVLGVLMIIGIVVGPQDKPVTPTTFESAPGETVQIPERPPSAGAHQDDDVYLVESDPNYHTFFCRTTGDADAQRTGLSDAIGAGFRPCEVCQSGQR